MKRSPQHAFSSGFTLLEMLIVVAVVAILGTAGVSSLRGFGKDSELLAIKKTLVADIRYAQSRAMIGDGGFRWGVRAVNSTTDYYEIFSTPTDYASGEMIQVSTTTLPRAISFSDPSSESFKEVIFSKITGTTTPVSISLTAEDRTEVITITDLGSIY